MLTKLLQLDFPNNNNNDDDLSAEANQIHPEVAEISKSENKQLLPAKTNQLKRVTEKIAFTQKLSDWWQKMSLRRKATAIALVMGVIPVAAVGGIAYTLSSHSLLQQIVAEQESRTQDILQKLTLFTQHIIDDASALADSPVFSDPQLKGSTTVEDKIAMLNSFIDSHQDMFDSIAVFDVEGNLLYQSKSPQPIDTQDNYSNREYFQRAIVTQAPAVNHPPVTNSENLKTVEIAAPIKEEGTEKIIGIVNLRMPLENLGEVFRYVEEEGWEYRLLDSEEEIFAATEQEFIGKPGESDLDSLPELMAKINSNATGMSEKTQGFSEIMNDRDDNQEVLVTLAAMEKIDGLLEPGWKLILSRPLEESYAPLNQLRLTLLLGTTGAALLVGAIAAVLASQLTGPILTAAEAVKKIGKGQLDTRLQFEGQDELATLGTNINKMAQQLKVMVDYQTAEANRSRILKDFTLKLSRSTSSEEIFNIAVKEILPALRCDRVLLCSFDEKGEGKILAESVANQKLSFVQEEIIPLELVDDYSEKDRGVRIIPDIYEAGLKINVIEQLEEFGVKASLVAPIFLGKNWHGLLIVHQCDRPRQWQKVEVDFFAQLTSQVILSLERTRLLEQQKVAQEQLHNRALELLMEVEPISQGDLTIRATVTEDEIGTLADSYNCTVENLRQIVTQVQKVVAQMASISGNNEGFARELSARASRQSEAIAAALNQIQTIAQSIHSVAKNAAAAEATVQDAARTVASGGKAMNETVDAIAAIRSTVAETGKKVKRLGESSQKISKVVNLISGFAAQTNLLALNASLEASRAGQAGQNFAVVAEEVRLLAQQSAQATIEIEKIVASIQLDTREVAAAMEEGTEKVVVGSKLVEQTRQNLNQIAQDSDRIGSSIKAIAHKTVEQSEDSQAITQRIAEVATMATTTSTDATQLSNLTKELLKVAEQLQESVRQFKVE
jgi:methyl-accepting chemotaxis protein PixJ